MIPENIQNNTNLRAKSKTRSYLIKFFFIGLTMITVVYSLLHSFTKNYITTDNAYVGAEIAQIMPATSGTVKEIMYNDTDIVKKGETLVIIDDTDAKLSLAKAKTELRKIRLQLDKAKIDYERKQALAKSGTVAAEEVSNLYNEYKITQAVFDSAAISLQQAEIDVLRTNIKAPIDGVIAKRQVQLGQRIQPNNFLMSIVPLHIMHVDANFKEVQLEKVKIGQKVEMVSDFYGSKVLFHGTVLGISGGTGSAFSIIPAQNATGNWIKVIQRLPVRISLDEQELKKYPLKVGLSMKVKIFTN